MKSSRSSPDLVPERHTRVILCTLENRALQGSTNTTIAPPWHLYCTNTNSPNYLHYFQIAAALFTNRAVNASPSLRYRRCLYSLETPLEQKLTAVCTIGHS